MHKVINDTLLKIGKCAGVEIFVLPGDELLFSGVILKLEKNKVRKEKEFHFLTSYEQLSQKCGTNLPVAVTLNGRGILHKKFPLNQLVEGAPLQSVLPNANPNELYVTVTRLEEIASIAVARKEIVDKILDGLKQHGFHVLSISIGIEDILTILPFITLDKGVDLQTPQFTLQLDERRQVVDIENIHSWDIATYDKVEYNVGDQYVSSPALLSFGGAMALMANGPGAPLAFSPQAVLQERENFTYSRYYKTSLWSVLIFLFCVLFINFLVYEHYFSLNKDRADNRQLSQEQEKKMQKQLTWLQSQEAFIRQQGWDQGSRLSLYADRIAGLTPSGTVLTDLLINPVNSTLLGDGGAVSFKKDTLQLNGTCDDPTELNQFTNNLKAIQQFKEVDIRSYNYKKELGSGIFFMEIITK